MAHRFVLIHCSMQKVTDLDGNVIGGLQIGSFQRAYDALTREMKSQGGCEAVFELLGPAYLRARNSPMAEHAEENILDAAGPGIGPAGTKRILINSALINIEPCHDNRYPGHNCQSFFRSAGRLYKNLNCGFVPGQADTPIFYTEAQPPAGSTSTMSRTLMRMSAPDAKFYLANLGTAMWGAPLQNLTTKTWSVAGQRYMFANEIAVFLNKFAIKFSTWDSTDGGFDAAFIANVQSNTKLQ
ncbi:hypothetical protein B0H67DRAFT_583024 [Lasiosphaeris hirsuta]|uniref:Uncharacterized protein n=1 Tax=Lasiosphaeris hirsuta TaxID=260670 RepID=A0AA40DNW4_9PEZI|nr:hypothetical protein B0H67DRAFT_583024 [Lasiosphaeris hirsuta]